MKINLKLIGMLLLGSSVTFMSCDKDDDKDPIEVVDNKENQVIVSSNITTNTTWSKDKIYVLAGRIAVTSGAELTIEAGTIIKGQAGAGSNATALLVARGAKINAIGTATEPIIFTSTADNIQPGEVVSPNMPNDLSGLWGGLIVLGDAKASLKGDVQEASIEGIPASDPNGRYGGTNDADNSGVLKYVSIRHGGANIGEGNEINGLTLGAVGSGTEISNIEIVANADDGIEWFGGTVNVSNVVVWNAGDDAIDTDQAWAGTLTNFIIVNPGDEGFELDGPEGSYQGAGHTITNGTLIAKNASGLIDFDDNTDVNISNIYFSDLTIGQDIEGFSGYAANTNGFAAATFQATLPTVDEDGNPATYTTADFFKGGADAITTATNSATVGGNTADLTWTWASKTANF